MKNIPREVIEKDLIHCGFLIFDCPLKTTTVSTIQDLRSTNYHVKIITGDNAYTACEIAKEACIIDKEKPVLFLSQSKSGYLFSLFILYLVNSIGKMEKINLCLLVSLWIQDISVNYLNLIFLLLLVLY